MNTQETVTISRESYDWFERFVESLQLTIGFFFLRVGKLFLGLYYKG